MKITALAGGVGGARLAHGLAEIIEPGKLSIVVNTGDDFEHLGLFISPDVDTVCYTLAGIANPSTGWGIVNDTFHTFESLRRLDAPDWFKLGDIDLATHLERTRLLQKRETLTHITQHFCHKLGVRQSVLPMTDDRVATWVETEEFGLIPFQEYFVKHHCAPKFMGFHLKGIEDARPTESIIQAIDQADAVVICPSNPFVSIDPILSLAGVRDKIAKKFTICISPIIGGKAVKGPLEKMFRELGDEPSPQAVIDHYLGLVDCMVVDLLDKDQISSESRSSIIIHATDILIPNKADRIRLAEEVIDLIEKYF